MSLTGVVAVLRGRPQHPIGTDGRMALSDHFRELRARVIRVALYLVVGTVVAWVFWEQLFQLIYEPYQQASIMLGEDVSTRAVINGVGGPLMLQLKIAAVAAVVGTSPLWLAEIWGFLAPGLHRQEKRWSRVFIAVAGPLFITGVIVGYYVLPKGIEVLLGFTPTCVESLVDFGEYFSFVTRMMLVFGVAFEIPLFVVMLNLAGIVKGVTLGPLPADDRARDVRLRRGGDPVDRSVLDADAGAADGAAVPPRRDDRPVRRSDARPAPAGHRPVVRRRGVPCERPAGGPTVTSPAEEDVDPFDLPEWLLDGPVTWQSAEGIATGHLVQRTPVTDAEGHDLPCDLVAVDDAYPVPVADDSLRTRAHLAWRYGQVLLVRRPDAVTLAVPGTASTPSGCWTPWTGWPGRSGADPDGTPRCCRRRRGDRTGPQRPIVSLRAVHTRDRAAHQPHRRARPGDPGPGHGAAPAPRRGLRGAHPGKARTPTRPWTWPDSAIADGVESLVVCGGDGIIHLGVQAVAGTDITLGILPAGTGNDVARYLDLPLKDPLAAIDRYIAGRTRRIDLARSGSKYFATVLAAGFDALVNERANQMSWPKGQMRYNIATLAELRTFTPLHYTLELDGQARELDAMMVAVGNGPSFGGGLRITEGALLDDGLLDVVLFKPMSRVDLVRTYPQLFKGTHTSHPQYEHHRVSRVTVASPGIVAYADGERFGELPLTVECAPGALTVVT